jgi:aryl-alcohol dehydrogenase-like predicted oxidoreductase
VDSGACVLQTHRQRMDPRRAGAEPDVSLVFTPQVATATLPVLSDRQRVEGPTLPLRTLGRTGLSVTAAGLGLAALGRPAYMARGRNVDLGVDRSVAAMKRRCHDLLDVAYAAGVRYVDVARSYGLAELFLREWWNERQLPDDALTVGSKWGYTYTGAWQLAPPAHEVKSLTLDTLKRQAAESRALLGRHLSLYQIHSATLESGVLDDAAVLAELVSLHERGLYIGITVTGPRQADIVRRALDVRVDGVNPFDVVQATWNLLEPSATVALAEAKAEGCGVIIKEVLANGRLTSRHGGPELRSLRTYAAGLCTSVESVAIAAALAQPWADVVLSGAVTCEQLQEHVAAVVLGAHSVPPVPIAEPSHLYWRRRATLAWR